jgi:hypothetical protein
LIAASVHRRAFSGKLFFSEEKNQKTFIFALAERSVPWPTDGELRKTKSLLLLFFSVRLERD